MKSIINFKLVFALVMLAFACQPDDDFPELVDPLAIKPGVLSGTWKVAKVVQYDKEALDNGFPPDVQQRDITSVFPFSEYTIKFDLDASGRPAAFTVTPGNAPNFLNLASGLWSVDDFVFTTRIMLSNPAQVGESSFRVKVLNRDQIRLQIVRNDLNDNTEYSFYEYEFVKN